MEAAWAENLVGRAPDTDRRLDDSSKPEQHVRIAATGQPVSDMFPQPGQFKGLAVQRRGDAARAGGEEDPLQRLPGVNPKAG